MYFTTSMNTVFKYTISPFNECSYKCEHASQEDIVQLRRYLDQRFGNWCYTERGRSAIDLALSHYSLNPDDVVTIFTTSGNFYISSCVTNEIEKHCRWSREIEPKTKLIFVNNEFGYPYNEVEKLKEYGLPIIEDCAYNFFTQDNKGLMGKVGDFAIFSLSKAFSVSFGGILVANNMESELGQPLKENLMSELEQHIAVQIKNIESIKAARLRNYDRFFNKMRCFHIEPFFHLASGVVPGVILFKWKDSIDYPSLKSYLQNLGVESTVFYGKSAFYLPIHQNLKDEDIDYICEMIIRFQKKER